MTVVKIAGLMFAVTCVAGSTGAPPPDAPPKTMAPLEQYLMPAADEIALARSAAPLSISANATVLVLGAHGYTTAAKGTNGFTCMVERGWEADFGNPEFWDTRVRGPLCFNAEAARTVMPSHLERTDWALAGISMEQMKERASKSVLANTTPALGAMCFMMSKDQRLTGADGHWHPHLMFYLPAKGVASWGANMAGSPVLGGPGDPEPVVTYMIPVTKWSDGSPAMEMTHS